MISKNQSSSAEYLTGFEHKPLRVVIENWLYLDDLNIVRDAAVELRRRFRKTFPQPDWVKRGEI